MENHLLPLFIVDDSESDLAIAREALRASNLLTLIGVARSGDEALAYLRGGGKSSPLLILLDINMPKRSGFEVLEEIKGDPALKHVPVVMFTTSWRDEDVTRAYAAGACSFITKPADFLGLERMFANFETYWGEVSRFPRQ